MATGTIRDDKRTRHANRLPLPEKEKLFAKRLFETGDKHEAIKAVSEATNRTSLNQVINKFMKSENVKAELERLRANEHEFSRDDLKRRILDDLKNPKLTATQKKDLYNLYEKTTRFEIERDAEMEEKALLAQLEIGDAIEQAIDGDTLKFDQFFDITVSATGKPTFRLKKNDLENKKLAYLCLLTLLKKQNVFASGM